MMQQQAREEMETSRESSSKESEAVHEEIKMKERAKMQVEVKKVQEELDKVSKHYYSIYCITMSKDIEQTIVSG